MSHLTERVKRILTNKNIEFEEFEHEAVYTSEQAAKVRGLHSAKQGVKAMIFKIEAGRFILVLNPGDKRVDTKKIAELEHAKHVSIAKPEEVQKVAGVTVGCVPPFGLDCVAGGIFSRMESRQPACQANPHHRHVLMFQFQPAPMYHTRCKTLN